MDYLPLFLDLARKRCLVVGAGDIAQRKIDLLLRANALVTVVAPEANEAIQGLSEEGAVQLVRRAFRPFRCRTTTTACSEACRRFAR